MSLTAMLEALHAEGPDPALAEELMLFGQFVGSWDVDITYHRPDGSRLDLPGEWHFGWVLEGRAIQDVWMAPRRELRGKPGYELGDYGATLRFYDPGIGAWRSTWIGPYKGYVIPFIARAVGDEIVLEGSYAEGQTTRWIFSAITPDSFRWRHVDLPAGSSDEVLRQTMAARRRAS
jgi:hypothetical protein